MAAFFSNVAQQAKAKAMEMLPSVIQSAEPQVQQVLETAFSKMSTDQKQLFLTNWNKLNTVVQANLTAPTAVPASAGKRRKRTHKLTRKNKH